jgi:uncharacterized membrane protein
MMRTLILVIAALTMACGGSAVVITTPQGLVAVVTAVQLISSGDDAADEDLVNLTLTLTPVNINVSHWDPAVPDKIPPLDDTDIAARGFLTLFLDNMAIGDLQVAFPVGAGPNGFTVYGEMPVPMGADSYHIVHLEVQTDVAVIPADPLLLYEYNFAFDADRNNANNYMTTGMNYFPGTDRWYQLTWSNAQGWRLNVRTAITDMGSETITEVPSAACVIMTGNAILLVVPASEFGVSDPEWRVTAFVHDGDFGIPAPYSWSGNSEPRVVEGLAVYPPQ